MLKRAFRPVFLMLDVPQILDVFSSLVLLAVLFSSLFTVASGRLAYIAALRLMPRCGRLVDFDI